MIGPFQGQYRWLSNFWMTPVYLDGVKYPSVEHAYQAAKSLDPEYRLKIKNCPTPGQAKRVGRTAKLRKDWEFVKINMMLGLVKEKFETNDELRAKLLATGKDEIVEINHWGDTFWGVDNAKGGGKNHLGQILMTVRDMLA